MRLRAPSFPASLAVMNLIVTMIGSFVNEQSTNVEELANEIYRSKAPIFIRIFVPINESMI